MNGSRRFFKRFFQSEARIIQPRLIDELQRSIRPDNPGHRWNSVNHKPELPFALAQGVFHLPAFRNVLHRAENADRPARLVSHDIVSNVNEPYVTIASDDPGFQA